jgi:exosortase A
MTSVVRQNRVALFITFGFLVIAFVLYAKTFLAMVSIWLGSNTYLHGLVIIPLSIYLSWRDRKQWLSFDFKPSWLGILLLASSTLAWLLGSVVSVQVINQFAFISMLIAIIWSVMGTDVVRALHFPLLFAFFAVPFGEFVIPKLMDWTANVTVFALQVTGIPVFREGNFFSLPSGNFRVIEACSGIRFLIVTIVLGVYFAYENFRDWTKRSLFLLAAISAIIGANWVRAYLVVFVAHATDMRFGSGQSHIYMGWVIFLAVILTLFWIGRRFSEDTNLTLSENIIRPSATANTKKNTHRHRDTIKVSLVLILLAAGPVMLQRMQTQDTTQLHAARPALPSPSAGWSGPKAPRFGYAPKFAGAAHEVAGRYQRMGQTVEFHLVVYAQQGQGAEIVGWGNQLFDKNQWRSLRRRTLNVSETSGRKLNIYEEVIASSTQILRVWRWYDIGGYLGSDPYWVKWKQAWNAISGNNRGDAAVVVVEQITDSAITPESETLREFVSSHIRAIRQCLEREPGQETGTCVSAENSGKSYVP